MRPVYSRLVVAAGLLALACATATGEGPLGGDIDDGTGGTAPAAGTSGRAGSSSQVGGSSSEAGTSSSAGTSSEGGKGGTGTSAFGGTSPSGGTSSGGTASGGKGGSSSGGSSSGGGNAGAGGTGSGGSAAGSGGKGGAPAGGSGGTAAGGGGSGSGGTATTTCSGVPDWTDKVYAMGDIVASTCAGVFAPPCTAGQSHKFKCEPQAGAVAVGWCKERQPGVGNTWDAAWVDLGQCTK